MPIPTRSQSVRGTVPPGQGGSKTRAAAEQGTNDEGGSQKASATSRGTSALPQPRKVATSRLPCVPGGHTRTHSASTANVSQANTVNRNSSAAPRTTAHNAVIESGVNAYARTLGSNPRSVHLRSQSTAIGTAHKPQIGLKPAFNTYQQHFSPQKPETCAQSALREVGGRSAFGIDASSPHFSKIQDELLQLTLVHARSQETLKRYATSANAKLEVRSLRLKREEAEVAELEQKQQEDVNALGLVKWFGKLDQDSAFEQVRALSLSIQKLSDLTNEDGDFTRIEGQFAKWQADARSFLDENPSRGRRSPMSVTFVNELNPAWHQTVEALKTQLRFCKLFLHKFVNLNIECALGTVISDHRQLASTMLEQLQLWTQLHSSLIKLQEEHISRTLTQVVSERKGAKLPREPLWETLTAD